MNTFGRKLRLTTFGESHGNAIGGVIDGFPSGVKIDEKFIQAELDKRKPGGKFATARKENDKVQIFSGIFEGVSIGTPIGFIIFNENQKSKDYENIKNLFRPGHADFGYFKKFVIRDYRGGGRSSARETAVRVAAGAFAQILLNEFDICVQSGIFSIGSINKGGEISNAKNLKMDFDYAQTSEIFSLFKEFENEMKNEILNAKNAHDSVGGNVVTRVKNVPAGLGEVLYDKIDAKIAYALMGINGVKAVEIGAGVKASEMIGSENNDEILPFGKFKTNHSGGILGGITNGDEIIVKSHFKPTPSIFLAQNTIDESGAVKTLSLKGRHDPCIAVRGSVVATAMMRLIVADMMLLNLGSTLTSLKKFYL
ncbi:chorismate synthase [Campylobacter hominis]|uniref:Chorismate synthase n=1 Tax=Campylobacter hominis (strain ATCC BAA-381 / DSM 21671 / CCUG 45161 / LMG 19568 / NCTC 13146 / CH001A) TaxID=360107 RepID=AROC_CAMHC|nr:chorismate synthase [Campylobacter hominis]A7HZN6.1 RecName: Full=Chorismate synthase; Short=CS; AltName: Full=5-enolpyruvylshikimate-3-phosphate phospholyase [Campylobacter hominis ATCC BAA-381]ABS51781.1 chorismate synthase [Campylobacter hominis ATCC BAA-381]UAK85414.1 chorismate synthase [Campylobacter hominis]SUW84276.1 chorismate synthase [Campylobacter hominis]